MRDFAGQPDEALCADLEALLTHLDRQAPGDDVDALVLVRVDVPAGTRRQSFTAAASLRKLDSDPRSPPEWPGAVIELIVHPGGDNFEREIEAMRSMWPTPPQPLRRFA